MNTLLPSPAAIGAHIQFSVFADGASSRNGNGGYGGIVQIRSTGEIFEFGGESTETTNNKMELAAVIHGLALARNIAFKRGMDFRGKIVVVSDSQYVLFGITKWVDGWQQHNWMSNGMAPVKNKEFWTRLMAISDVTQAEFLHVRGHRGIEGNEKADEIAGIYKKMAKSVPSDLLWNLDRAMDGKEI